MKTSAAQVKCGTAPWPLGQAFLLPPANRLAALKPADSANSCVLFNFNLCACGLDLFLDLVSFFLCHAFLNGLGRSFNERFRIRQAQSRYSATNFFNHSNLVRTHFL